MGVAGSSEDQNEDHLAIVVVAAGRGARAGGGLPKQYRDVAGASVLARSLAALHRAAPQATIVVSINADDGELYARSLASLPVSAQARLRPPAFGGATRQESVRAGLEVLAKERRRPSVVLIHDAARIFPSEALVARAIRAAKDHGAAIPGVPVTDTIKEIAADGSIEGTPDRARLRAVQTPQAFAFDLILDAHRRTAEAGVHGLTDDAAIAEWAGERVFVFEGDVANMKITSADDLAAAEAKLVAELVDVRLGQGYDVHALGEGGHIWLGGVKIAHDHGLVGHSDADVLSHAVTDALLGALADGDIGSHFPPSDPQWKGARSDIFLAYAASRVRERGGMIAHVDATLVCERPKVGPHRDAIRASLAATMGVSIDRVAVKATTSERLGFTGREEGIAALAVATVRLPLKTP
ncbi:bifunctional 2-C-methyl-D-erythritol 4-phosphate cytidylyltransferase/2-C-methyl-D-erythritol 2,4-cyclodiphosphate synthase [Methylocella sp.]|uniref:bifunctional 2-C-methyl-D-erythritol 4-phosphate cytidylyltransferase/2-C-methyl-D-erythritol 2,4-cyclodiphosphate synthase n=1 Tax=Methylocella sp. TaxID=1978226 RepID=UPI003783275D